MEICPHCVAAGITSATIGYSYFKNFFDIRGRLLRLKNWVKHEPKSKDR